MDNGHKELTEDATLHISESSPSLHYGQQKKFEGLKPIVQGCVLQLFRQMKMPNVRNAPVIVFDASSLTEMFVEACQAVVRAVKNTYHLMGLVEPSTSRPLLIEVLEISLG